MADDHFPRDHALGLPAGGGFHNLVFVSIRKTYPMQAYKIMDDKGTRGKNPQPVAADVSPV